MSAPILPERGPNRRPDGPPAARGHLERLIGHYAELTGVAPDRVRRWVSVMVLLGALDRVGEEEMPRFLLKGGIAIELRFGADARATKDVDLVFFGDPQVLEDDLDAAFDRTTRSSRFSGSGSNGCRVLHFTASASSCCIG